MTCINPITEKVSKMSLEDENMFSWIEDEDVRKTYIQAVTSHKYGIGELLKEKTQLCELKEEEIISIYFDKRVGLDKGFHFEGDYTAILEEYGIREAITMFARGVKKPKLYEIYENLGKWAFERRHNPTERSRIKKVEPMTKSLEILYAHKAN